MEKNIRLELDKLTSFPAMPEMASRILSLGSHPEVSELVEIVELDPGLAAQILRQATSPFFGYRGKVNSLRDAITRVLGMDRAMNLALGIAAGKALQCPVDGPVGRKAIWVHAAYSAALMQSLAECLPREKGVSPGMCYLGGLMHNIGLLVLGHLFPSELYSLTKAILASPRDAVIDLEQRLFMTNHTEIGMWLMNKWRMPGEVITVVSKHHDAEYQGDHAIYANLALLADRLLQRLEIGDAGSEELPVALLDSFGLEEDAAAGALQSVLESRSDLDSLASHLAAAA